jgi:hypothetical protein
MTCKTRIKRLEEMTGVKVFRCIICRKATNGFGNNAAPVKDGRCCDDCNSNVVIPTRIAAIYASIAADKTAGNV